MTASTTPFAMVMGYGNLDDGMDRPCCLMSHASVLPIIIRVTIQMTADNSPILSGKIDPTTFYKQGMFYRTLRTPANVSWEVYKCFPGNHSPLIFHHPKASAT
ncbi:hypothetical protein TNCV_1295951 [Trichonephila clavipes]|uniref:Uncharacterized protein n=1 Tax=Trichonephila clavipes TaxID=2585209 RepID=A0A8X6SHS2_TRICX|nr:hypothetical protein TNCV_1295951 [Trichonephila clavipes]